MLRAVGNGPVARANGRLSTGDPASAGVSTALLRVVGNGAVARASRADPDSTVALSTRDDAAERRADRYAQGHKATAGLAPSSHEAGRRPGGRGSDLIVHHPKLRAAVEDPPPGRAVDRGIRTEMESALGADLGDVRVHDTAADQALSASINARAFVHRDHVWIGPDASASDRAVMAHELTHVVQQRVSAQGGQPRVQRWVNLGSESWYIRGGLFSRDVTVWTGTKEEWMSVLDDIDDADEYNEHLQGFLEVSNDPSLVGRTRPPRVITNNPANVNFQNTIVRAPNNAEKLAFLEALYAMGDDLDLWRGGVFEGGPYVRSADAELSEFIQNNQGLYLSRVSHAGQSITEGGVGAVVGQTGRSVTMALIMNAGATAHKGVDLIVAANRLTGQAYNTAHARAYELIRNAARTIRATLEAHDARIAFQQAVVGAVFDQVWGMIPGGGQLRSAAQAALKFGLKRALNKAASDSGPSAQADTIRRAFVETCNNLVFDGHMQSADAQDAINGFEAGIR